MALVAVNSWEAPNVMHHIVSIVEVAANHAELFMHQSFAGNTRPLPFKVDPRSQEMTWEMRLQGGVVRLGYQSKLRLREPMRVHPTTTYRLNIGRLNTGILCLAFQIGTDWLPIFWEVFGINISSELHTKLEKQTMLSCDWVLRQVWRFHTRNIFFIPCDVISKLETLSFTQPSPIPQAPQIR